MLRDELAQISKTFDANCEKVLELMHFDQLVLELAIHHLEQLHERLTVVHELDNPRLDVSHTLQMLRNIHGNDSLQPQYEEMLNQCNVLLVSYFSAAVGDVFRASVTDAVRYDRRPGLMKEEIKIGLRDVREIGAELIDRVGELFVAHRDISFQDMQSIGRAFREHFGYEPGETQP